VEIKITLYTTKNKVHLTDSTKYEDLAESESHNHKNLIAHKTQKAKPRKWL